MCSGGSGMSTPALACGTASAPACHVSDLKLLALALAWGTWSWQLYHGAGGRGTGAVAVEMDEATRGQPGWGCINFSLPTFGGPSVAWWPRLSDCVCWIWPTGWMFDTSAIG